MRNTFLPLALVVGCLFGSGCATRDGMGIFYESLEVYVDEEGSERLKALADELQRELLGLDTLAVQDATRGAFPERDPWKEGGAVDWSGFELKLSQEPLEYDTALLGSGGMHGRNGFLLELPELPDGVTCLAELRLGVSSREGPGLAGYPSYLPIQVFLRYHDSVASGYRQCFVLNELLIEEILGRLRAKLGAVGIEARLFRSGREL